MSWTAVNWNNNIVYNFVISLNFFVLWLLSDITVHYCSLDAGKLKLNTAYNCSVELTEQLYSLSFVINIFLFITCTAENPPGTKTATLGSFSNDDGDFNENGKKTIGWDWQNNNSVHASRFLYLSLPLLNDYDVKLPNFTFCWGSEQKTTILPFFSWTSIVF